MDLFQEVIQVSLEPLGGVVGRVRGDVQPGLGVHVHVLLLGRHIKVELVEFVRFYQVDGPEGFLAVIAGNVRQLRYLNQDFDDGFDGVVVLVLVPQLRLVASDLPQDDNNHPDETEHSQSLSDGAHEVEDEGDDDDDGIEQVEVVEEVHEVARERLQNDFKEEEDQEVVVDRGQYLVGDWVGHELAVEQPEEDEYCIDADYDHREYLERSRLQQLEQEQLQLRHCILLLRDLVESRVPRLGFVDLQMQESADDDAVDEVEGAEALALIHYEGKQECPHNKIGPAEGVDDVEIINCLSHQVGIDCRQDQLVGQDLAVLPGFVPGVLDLDQVDAEELEEELDGLGYHHGDEPDPGCESEPSVGDLLLEDGLLAGVVRVQAEQVAVLLFWFQVSTVLAVVHRVNVLELIVDVVFAVLEARMHSVLAAALVDRHRVVQVFGRVGTALAVPLGIVSESLLGLDTSARIVNILNEDILLICFVLVANAVI
mmetsp:Transcript_31696/g.48535  ORF Transcript_31696/g.48535 Transcript_31696/m.48535 type:complete len:484 (+) Transcript_31696:1122-2573(+)